MTWALDQVAGEGLKLTLGVPDSDDLFLMFLCQPRSGEVAMTVVARPQDGAAVELASGDLRRRYPAAGLASEETDGAVDLQAKLAADDPVLRRVADTGQLTVTVGRTRTRTPNAFAPFHDFIAACRAR
jgi:hypothetical protein